MISRMCEDFGCLPSQAVRELDRDPDLVGEVMQLRAYQRTKQQYDDAKTKDDLPKGPMADLVADIEFERYQARLTDGE